MESDNIAVSSVIIAMTVVFKNSQTPPNDIINILKELPQLRSLVPLIPSLSKYNTSDLVSLLSLLYDDRDIKSLVLKHLTLPIVRMSDIKILSNCLVHDELNPIMNITIRDMIMYDQIDMLKELVNQGYVTLNPKLYKLLLQLNLSKSPKCKRYLESLGFAFETKKKQLQAEDLAEVKCITFRLMQQAGDVDAESIKLLNDKAKQYNLRLILQYPNGYTTLVLNSNTIQNLTRVTQLQQGILYTGSDTDKIGDITELINWELEGTYK